MRIKFNINKFRILIFLLLILIITSNTYSNNISNLINTYNYSYQSPQLELNLNNNSIVNNSLNLNLNLIYKNSSLIFIFGTTNDILETNKIFLKNISNGINNLNFSFDLNYLKTQIHSFYFKIFDKNENIFRNDNYLILNILNISNSTQLNFSLFNFTNSLNYSQKYFLKNNSINYNSTFQIKNLIILSENATLPDISILNISYNKSIGALNLSIKNIGKNIMPSFLISIFDENSTKILEAIQKIILINQSINLSYNISKNNSKLFVYLDYYNQYEEIFKYNNFLSWPVNLTEICFDNIDNNRDGFVDENCKIKIAKKIIHNGGSYSHSNNKIKKTKNNNSNLNIISLKNSTNISTNNTNINYSKKNNSVFANNSNNTTINLSIPKMTNNNTFYPIFKKNNLIEKSFKNNSLNSNDNFLNSHKLTISTFLAGIIFIILNFLFN